MTILSYECLFINREVQWQYIVSQFNRAKQTHSDGGYKQVLHMAVVLFIQSFYFYVSHVEANIAAGKFKIVKLSLV